MSHYLTNEAEANKASTPVTNRVSEERRVVCSCGSAAEAQGRHWFCKREGIRIRKQRSK